MIDFYREWTIRLTLGRRPSATISDPQESLRILVERETEAELYQAVVQIIDQAFIDEHAIAAHGNPTLGDFDAVEMRGAEL